MHVVLISDCERAGGAAVCTSRLAAGLLGQGATVTRLVRYGDAGNGRPWAVHRHAPSWGRRLIARSPLADVLRPGVVGGALRWLETRLEDLRPDVVNVHNLHGAWRSGWGTELVERCSRRAPTFWTLHDMWSFTGRCAYSGECRRFPEGCDSACPTPNEYPALAPGRIAAEWNRRRDLLGRFPGLAAISPSRWLAQEAALGLWKGHRIGVIPYGIPLDIYRPLNRREARRALGLPESGLMVLLAAHVLTDPRKGGDTLGGIVAGIRPPFDLLTLGHGSVSVPHFRGRILPMGFVSDEARKTLVFNAADLLLHVARADNLPNVALEALACGTPVVAVPVGGVPEIVRPGVSGWLSPGPSAADLRGTLSTALEAVSAEQTLRESCRGIAEREYPIDLQARRTLEFFREGGALA